MIKSLCNALSEGRDAAAVADNFLSANRLRLDFLMSRLLRLGRFPGYNAPRSVRILGGRAIHYRFNRGDIQSLREIFLEQVYQCELPKVTSTILDLGANIGLASVWLGCRYIKEKDQSNPIKPCLLAVEPVQENAAIAEMNLFDNSIPGEVVRAAVGQQSGEAWFNLRPESNTGRVVGANRGSDVTLVPVVGIRELIDRFPRGCVDLVKMDIEGAEGDLLSGNPSWLENIGALIVEWHDERTDSAPLIQNVEKFGFSHRRINESRQQNLSLFVRV